MLELRSALFALLEDPVPTAFDDWQRLIARVSAAIAAIEVAPPLLVELETLVAEFRAEAIRVGKGRFAYSPLYPWGIVDHVTALDDRLRYRELARGHVGPCDCALVRDHEMYDMVEKASFVKTASSGDFYDPYEDFTCSHCGSVWRHSDCSTEQDSAWSWSPLSSR